MFVGNFLHHGQAQTGTFGLGGDVGLERPLQDIGSKPWPFVGDGQFNPFACRAPARGEGHLGMCLAGVLGILNEVVNHLAQLLGIAFNHGQCRIQIGHNLGTRGCFGGLLRIEHHHVLNEAIQVQGVEFGRGQSGVIPEFVHQPLHGGHLVHNGFDRFGQDRLVGFGQFAVEFALQPFC